MCSVQRSGIRPPQEEKAMWLVERVVVAEVAPDGKLTSKSVP